MTTVTSTMTVQKTLGAYCTAELIFFHDFPVNIWGAYYTNAHIIFKFLWYSPREKSVCLIQSAAGHSHS